LAYTQIGIRLPGELIADVDDFASEAKSTRLEIIREILTLYFEYRRDQRDTKTVAEMTDEEILTLLASMTSVM
jgi:metal-responsive CopG/Arc/MetJ family transcriptional regulator